MRQIQMEGNKKVKDSTSRNNIDSSSPESVRNIQTNPEIYENSNFENLKNAKKKTSTPDSKNKNFTSFNS